MMASKASEPIQLEFPNLAIAQKPPNVPEIENHIQKSPFKILSSLLAKVPPFLIV